MKLQKEEDMAKIYEVTTANVALKESFPTQTTVTATGTANSGGWSGFELILVQYVVPPADGIQDFVFHGNPPSGDATDVMDPGKTASITLFGINRENYWGEGQELKGFRVVAKTNAIVTDYI